MVHRPLNIWRSRLRFVLAYPPWLLMAGGSLIVIAAFLHVIVLPGLEMQIESGERDLRQIERANRHARFEQKPTLESPESVRLGLLDQFSDHAHLPAELGRLLDLANDTGLQMPTGDYQLMIGKDKPFDKYVLTLPVQGSYQDIRRYIVKLRASFPTLAIEDISLRRNNIGQTQLDAQLRLVMFVRSQEAK